MSSSGVRTLLKGAQFVPLEPLHLDAPDILCAGAAGLCLLHCLRERLLPPSRIEMNTKHEWVIAHVNCGRDETCALCVRTRDEEHRVQEKVELETRRDEP